MNLLFFFIVGIVWNKSYSLADIMEDNIDILIISETKVNDSDGQFFIDGFGTQFRLDRNRNGGVIMLFIRNDIPGKVVSTDDKPIKSLYLGLNFQKKKWQLDCFYNPKHSSKNHIWTI